MNDSATWIEKAETVARDVLAKHAADVDHASRWPIESIQALSKSGLLGLTVPASHGGAGQGPRTFAAVLSRLAQECASSGMIYLMHICGTAVISAADKFANRDAVKDVAVTSAEQVSGDGEGFGVMVNTVLPWFQLGNAAVSVGIARAAANGVRDHLSSAKLEHLGQTLASLPNLRAELARMQITADTQSAFLDHVAAKMENPQPDTMLAVLESKAAASEAALSVTDLAMRACGGTAFSGRLSVERNFRDARAGSVMAPTTDVLHDFIGKAVLGMPLF
jgi:alkylation response protein AidB-like acyl-CoA dehydrogenase